MTLSNNLQQLMRIHGNISVSELARLADIPQPTIHHILTGSTKNPRKTALEKLSHFFSVSITQLMGQEQLPAVIPDAVKEDLQISTIPVIEWELLKDWPSSAINIQHARQILVNKKLARNSFALVMPNTSMEPSFKQNTLLIFDSEKTHKDRDYVIVHFARDNLIVFNRLFTENGIKYLKQDLDDGNFQLTKLDESQERILGTLIESRVEY